jgi:lipoprotein-anchoring transpeptidase ErfK/SrfK
MQRYMVRGQFFTPTIRQTFFIALLLIVTLWLGLSQIGGLIKKAKVNSTVSKSVYWLMLHRASNKELLYKGIPGNVKKSTLIKTFTVKTGIPGERPTPLPQLARRDYWVIVSKAQAFDNPETAPYFLALDIPVGDVEPYGPVPYMECGGYQCNWQIAGPFGLHGTGGDPSRISPDNPGSSGCIRHGDDDIAYLYKTLNPDKQEIRYYIKDI